MKSGQYDVIIIGLGAMGSAAAYHVASSGVRVLGLDRFHPPHELGSSHGLTRIIREAYFEDPAYVPLVQRAYELWADLERRSRRQLMLKTGGVMVGPPTGTLVSGARRSAEEHSLRHEILSSVELCRRFPVFNPSPYMLAVWEPRAGVLFPERIIQSHLDLAAKMGATLRFNEPVLKWEASSRGVRVYTGAQMYTAEKLLVAVGPWISSLIPELELPLTIERQVLYWFEPRSEPESFRPPHCPVHIWEYEPGKFFYGFPELGDGVKVALHHQGEAVRPETVRREVSVEEIQGMKQLLKRFMPKGEGRLLAAAVCSYTNTPDEHFILDYHPFHPEVVLASPCSGHGFKFSSVVGEVVAKLLRKEQPRLDLSLFKLSRFIR